MPTKIVTNNDYRQRIFLFTKTFPFMKFPSFTNNFWFARNIFLCWCHHEFSLNGSLHKGANLHAHTHMYTHVVWNIFICAQKNLIAFDTTHMQHVTIDLDIFRKEGNIKMRKYFHHWVKKIGKCKYLNTQISPPDWALKHYTNCLSWHRLSMMRVFVVYHF